MGEERKGGEGRGGGMGEERKGGRDDTCREGREKEWRGGEGMGGERKDVRRGPSSLSLPLLSSPSHPLPQRGES